MNAFLSLKRGDLALIARNLSFQRTLQLAARHFCDLNHYYALEIRLNGNITAPQTRLMRGELEILNEEDLKWLKTQVASLTGEDAKDLLVRILFYENGFRNCYAYKIDGTITFLQWLVYPNENELLRTKYKGRYLPVKPQQVLIENSFTFPRYRGFGLMQFASAELLKIAKAAGYAGAICYVRKENVNALNNLMQIGFKIRKLVREHKLMGFVWRNW